MSQKTNPLERNSLIISNWSGSREKFVAAITLCKSCTMGNYAQGHPIPVTGFIFKPLFSANSTCQECFVVLTNRLPPKVYPLFPGVKYFNKQIKLHLRPTFCNFPTDGHTYHNSPFSLDPYTHRLLHLRCLRTWQRSRAVCQRNPKQSNAFILTWLHPAIEKFHRPCE